MTNKGVIRTERGWAGHFPRARRCRFRRNTLLTCGDIEAVVSTVGLMDNPYGAGFIEIGNGRYYETRAFYAYPEDSEYHNADISREIGFNSPWDISVPGADNKANEMHETVVREITEMLIQGMEHNKSHKGEFCWLKPEVFCQEEICAQCFITEDLANDLTPILKRHEKEKGGVKNENP